MEELDTRPVADILARYSTDNQNPVTIDVQVEKCREWCERNGYQVGKIFSDEAVSGMKETRAGYEACMMHLGMGGAQLVVVYDQSRMFREFTEWFQFRKDVDMLGARVASVTQPMVGGDLKDPAVFINEAATAMLNHAQVLITRQLSLIHISVNEASGAELMPPILVIADSFDIVLKAHRDEAEGYIERITQAGRSAGVHLLLTTQSVPGKNFLSQFPSKLCFRMPEKSDSKKILGGTVSEKLLNEGEAIFYSAGVFPRALVKTVFKEDSTIDNLLEKIKGKSAANYSESFIQEINRYAAPVQSEEVEDDDSQDPMLKAVVEVVIDVGQASTSLLQRRFKFCLLYTSRCV